MGLTGALLILADFGLFSRTPEVKKCILEPGYHSTAHVFYSWSSISKIIVDHEMKEFPIDFGWP